MYVPPYYVNDCSAETFERFKSDPGRIVDEILKLREGKPIIIRFGSYWGRPSHWRQDDVVDERRTCLETYAASSEQVSAGIGTPFISSLDILNGTDHDLDPEDLGYIGVDKVHMSEEGIRLLSDQIWDLGISPVQR
jgi:hypothetical protein